MSIKKLFEKNKQTTTVNKFLKKSAVGSLGDGIESAAHLSESIKKNRDFVSPLDFSDPDNFVKFGSAEKYYASAFDYISSSYPYDGSGLETTKFYNDLNALEKYVLNDKYPRSTGYVTFGLSYGTPTTHSSGYYSSSAEYIQTKGGPHSGTIYSTAQYRTNNLEFGGASGSAVEFCLKKDWSVSQVTSSREVVFDAWNGNLSSSHDYGRFTVSISSVEQDRFFVTMQSGTTGFYELPVPTTGGLNIGNNKWNQYSVTLDTSGSTVDIKFYQSGTCVGPKITYSAEIGVVTGSLISNLAALRSAPSGSADASDASMLGWGKLSGSLDEFRFWKKARNAEEVGRNWFSRVYGGSDQYLANVDLGVYYRFNEGVTDSTPLDKVVLDYSGRISNGLFVNYASGARSTGSAIDAIAYSASLSLYEKPDPIVRPTHHLLTGSRGELTASGKLYDYTNTARLVNTLPSWIIEEDAQTNNELSNITQIMASYLDTLHAQIGELSQLKQMRYISGSATASINEFPYNDRLLDSVGIQTPELFENAGLMEQFLQRDATLNFDQNLTDIKNVIYKNIYANLPYILKSKGSEKAIRNFIRCLGVDDDLIALNVYANNQDFVLDTSYKAGAASKKYVDFTGLLNTQDSYGTIYQHYNAENPESIGIITGSNDLGQYAFTIESEFIFPDKSNTHTLNHEIVTVNSASLFGYHSPLTASVTSSNLTWADYGNDHGLMVYAIKSASADAEITSPTSKIKDVSFAVLDRAGTTILTSSVFQNVYENQKWNLALSVRPTKYPFSDGVTGAVIEDQTSDYYKLEFYGVNYNTGFKRNSFYLTSSLTAASGGAMLGTSKRLYLGAHRTNFTGAVDTATDVRASSLVYWSDYIPTGTVDRHAQEVDSFGRLRPYRYAYGFQTGSSQDYIPAIETMALNWDFGDVSGSNINGRFLVADYSSGSVTGTSEYPSVYQGGVFSNINLRQHTGRGDFFATSSSPVRKQYVYTQKTQLPEYVASDDMVKILAGDVEVFKPNRRPTNFYFSLEKSMYRGISDRMLQMFASIEEMNNLIGEPVNKYRQDYKSMAKLREIFFRKVGNTPDLEKYLKYYKWLDTAMGQMIEQLFPASARHSEDVRTIVESHILERPKYHYHFLGNKKRMGNYPYPIGDGVVRSAGYSSNPHTRGWEFNHAPIPLSQATNGFWWKVRAERTAYPLSRSIDAVTDTGINTDRAAILSAAQTEYTSSQRPYIEVSLGSNDAGENIISQEHQSRARNNTGFSFDSFQPLPTPIQRILSTTKRAVSFRATKDGTHYRGKLLAPFQAVSSSITTGYQGSLVLYGISNVDLVDLHERPAAIQGPFTFEHVGGLQARHVNPLEQNKDSRKESYKLTINSGTGSFETIISGTVPKGFYRRGMLAQAPVNIKNIKTLTGTIAPTAGVQPIGNYKLNYEVVQTNDRALTNMDFVFNNSNYYLVTNHASGTGSSGSMASAFVTPPIRRTAGLTGSVDYFSPRQTGSARTNQTIIVNQFAAPGGKLVSKQQFRDMPSDQVSPNNVVTYRNEYVKRIGNNASRVLGYSLGAGTGYRGYLRQYTGWGGFQQNITAELDYMQAQTSGDGLTWFNDGLPSLTRSATDIPGNPNIVNLTASQGDVYTVPVFGLANLHKTQRNTIQRLSLAAYPASAGSTQALTASIRDNGFVTRPIPAADRTEWFLATSGSDTTGSENYDKWILSSSHYPSNILIPSSSLSTAEVYKFGAYSAASSPEWDIDALLSGTFSPFFTNSVGNVGWIWAETFPSFVPWTQTRTGELAQAKYYTQNNVYEFDAQSVNTNRGSKAFRDSYSRTFRDAGRSQYSSPNPGEVGNVLTQRYSERFIEPPLTSRYKPLKHTIRTYRGTPSKTEYEQLVPVELEYSYGNVLQGFANKGLNVKLGNKRKYQSGIIRRPYEILRDSYVQEVERTTTGVDLIKRMTYKETIYPQERYTYLSGTRSRLAFKNNFWREDGVTVPNIYFSDELEQLVKGGTTIEGLYPQLIQNLTGSAVITSNSVQAGRFSGSNLIETIVYASEQTGNFVTSQGYRVMGEEQLPWSHGWGTAISNPYFTLATVTGQGTGSIWPMDSFPYSEWFTARDGRASGFNTVNPFNAMLRFGLRLNGGGPGNITNDATLIAGAGQMQSGELMMPHFGQTIDGYDQDAEAGISFYQTSSIISAQYVYCVPTHVTSEKATTPLITLYDVVNPLTVGGSIYSRPDWIAGRCRRVVDGAQRFALTKQHFPSYATYNDYVTDIRRAGKEYTLIPEFRISEHMPTYKANGSVYTALTGALTLTGASDDLSSSIDANFFTRFTTTDLIEYLNPFMEHGTDDLEFNKKPKEFGLTSEAIVKLLPYDGFYPQTRTLEIATLFSESYGAFATYSGSTRGPESTVTAGARLDISDLNEETSTINYGYAHLSASAWRTVLRPFFAPGILYNSIKSGMGVQYPICRNGRNSEQFFPGRIAAGQVETLYSPLKGCLTGAFSGITEGFPGGRRRRKQGSAEQFDFEDANVNKMFWGDVIPFEGLLKPMEHFTDEKPGVVNADINTLLWLDVTASIPASSSFNDTLYRSAISNFLGVTPEFFLTQRETGYMTKFVAEIPQKNTTTSPQGAQSTSQIEERTATVSAQKAYIMEVVVRKTDNFNLYSNPYAFGTPTATGSTVFGWDELRAAGYGTATKTTVGATPEGRDWPLHRGEFAPFAPTYYYGPSIARLTYMPKESGEVTLGQILQGDDIYVEYVNSDGYYYDFASGSFASLTSSEVISSSNLPIYEWNRAWQNRQDLDATIVIDNQFPSEVGGKISPLNSNKWVIMPKWECPILDFPKPASRDSSEAQTPVSYNFSASVMRGLTNANVPSTGDPNQPGTDYFTYGMWHQYGVMPQENEGIYLYISDVDMNSTEFRLCGDPGSTGGVDPNALVQPVKKVPLFVLEASRSVDSLASLVGFKPEEIMPPNQWVPSRAKKMGTLGEDGEKTISEGIIAMPFYYDSENGRMRAMTLRANLHQLGPKIKEFRRAFTKYSMPPSLRKQVKNLLPPDYPSIPGFIDPFGGDDYDEVLSPAEARIPVIYLFEHTVAFSRQDLADIWQGILPSIGDNFKTSVVAIDHYMPAAQSEDRLVPYPEILSKQIELNIPRTGIPRADLLDTVIHPHKDGFVPEIRWLVFKVKQRGMTDYTTMMLQEINDGNATQNFNTQFGYISDSLPPGMRNSVVARKNRYTMNLYDQGILGVGRNNYNWPYDYCSLVELGKITSKVGFRPELEREERPEEPPPSRPGPRSRVEQQEDSREEREEVIRNRESSPKPAKSKERDPQKGEPPKEQPEPQPEQIGFEEAEPAPGQQQIELRDLDNTPRMGGGKVGGNGGDYDF